jgi:hypothetical protein
MWKVWGSSLAVVLVVSGCSTVNTRPVEIETPTAERHFIVTRPPSDPGYQRPRPQQAASAVVVDLREAEKES